MSATIDFAALDTTDEGDIVDPTQFYTLVGKDPLAEETDFYRIQLLALRKYITGPNVQIFATPGSHTWTKPQGCTIADIFLIGGGGGGGSGCLGAAATLVLGGSGGSPGGILKATIPLSQLGATETVIVGAGGAGGAGVTGTSNGSTSTAGIGGESTLFGAFQAMGGNAASSGSGNGGRVPACTIDSIHVPTGIISSNFPDVNGVSRQITVAAVALYAYALLSPRPAPGAAGGGIQADGNLLAPSPGFGIYKRVAATGGNNPSVGDAIIAAPGANTPGVQIGSTPFFTGAGGAPFVEGGNGIAGLVGSGPGNGGAGGGGARNGFTSGAGGAGGPGYAVIICR